MARQTEGLPKMPLRSPEYLAENLAPQLLAVTGSLFALAMITAVMRCYVRVFIVKISGWDGKSKLQWYASYPLLLTTPCCRHYDDHINSTFATTRRPLSPFLHKDLYEYRRFT